MGATTGISWTNSTFNPWRGCLEVSPACKYCYAAKADFRRFKNRGHWGADKARLIGIGTWDNPPKWQKEAALKRYKHLVFCASFADVFEKRPDLEQPRARLWDLIEQTPDLIWQLLTKRPENIMSMIPDRWHKKLPSNIWIMASAENQRWFNKRWPHLKKVPASVHGLSCEPLLDPIEFGDAFKGMDPNRLWIITGGEHENEHNARPVDFNSFRSLRDQCLTRKIPFFFKQIGNKRGDGLFTPKYYYNKLDGRTWEEFPVKHKFVKTKWDMQEEEDQADKELMRVFKLLSAD